MTTTAPTLPVMQAPDVAVELAAVTEYSVRAWELTLADKVWASASEHIGENQWRFELHGILLLVDVHDIGHGQTVYRVRVDAGFLYRRARAAYAE